MSSASSKQSLKAGVVIGAVAGPSQMLKFHLTFTFQMRGFRLEANGKKKWRVNEAKAKHENPEVRSQTTEAEEMSNMRTQK